MFIAHPAFTLSLSLQDAGHLLEVGQNRREKESLRSSLLCIYGNFCPLLVLISIPGFYNPWKINLLLRRILGLFVPQLATTAVHLHVISVRETRIPIDRKQWSECRRLLFEFIIPEEETYSHKSSLYLGNKKGPGSAENGNICIVPCRLT